MWILVLHVAGTKDAGCRIGNDTWWYLQLLLIECCWRHHLMCYNVFDTFHTSSTPTDFLAIVFFIPLCSTDWCLFFTYHGTSFAPYLLCANGENCGDNFNLALTLNGHNQLTHILIAVALMGCKPCPDSPFVTVTDPNVCAHVSASTAPFRHHSLLKLMLHIDRSCQFVCVDIHVVYFLGSFFWELFNVENLCKCLDWQVPQTPDRYLRLFVTPAKPPGVLLFLSYCIFCTLAAFQVKWVLTLSQQQAVMIGLLKKKT